MDSLQRVEKTRKKTNTSDIAEQRFVGIFKSLVELAPDEQIHTRIRLYTFYRRIRNRLSQKASRERQAIYIKDLERRLEESTKSDGDRHVALEEENRSLRTLLFEGHKKLESVQATLKALSDSGAEVLRLKVRHFNLDSKILLSLSLPWPGHPGTRQCP